MRSFVKAFPVTVAVPLVMLLVSATAVGWSSMIWMTKLPRPVFAPALLSVTISAMVSVDSVSAGAVLVIAVLSV